MSNEEGIRHDMANMSSFSCHFFLHLNCADIFSLLYSLPLPTLISWLDHQYQYHTLSLLPLLLPLFLVVCVVMVCAVVVCVAIVFVAIVIVCAAIVCVACGFIVNDDVLLL